MKLPLFLLMPIALLLCACTTGPQYPINKSAPRSPQLATQTADSVIGQQIVWGGQIISAKNLQNITQLEVVVYPLDWEQKPKTSATALGRILIEQAGYLETADYAPQRRVNVKGQISAIRDGRVGEATYRYPVINAEDLHLWPTTTQAQQRDSGFHFGFGVILTN